MKQRSRDTASTIIFSLVWAILWGWLIIEKFEQKWLWLSLFGIAGGLFSAWFVAVFFVQEAQEGTPQSLKNNWKPVLLSVCFWICPAVTLLLGLIFR